MIAEKLFPLKSGTELTIGLVNKIIKRIEYAALLLSQYKLVEGSQTYIEPHYDGTRVSFLRPVGGGAAPSFRGGNVPFPLPLWPIASNGGQNPAYPLDTAGLYAYYGSSGLYDFVPLPAGAKDIYLSGASGAIFVSDRFFIVRLDNGSAISATQGAPGYPPSPIVWSYQISPNVVSIEFAEEGASGRAY